MRFVAVVTKQYSAVANTLNEHVTTQCELRVRMNMMEKDGDRREYEWFKIGALHTLNDSAIIMLQC